MAIEISSAHSAQGSRARANPFVEQAIQHILDGRLLDKKPECLSVADQGCGKLRHLPLLLEHFNTVYLVDTEFQLGRRQALFGQDNATIRQYVESLHSPAKTLRALTDSEFACSALGLDLVFNICVFDVETPKQRSAMAMAVHRNLRDRGIYILIIPRNDHSILRRCTADNAYLDGHAFHHHGVHTFYKNFRDAGPLLQLLAHRGFSVESDLSVYRQICLLLRKQTA